jgi:hypothetical protein
VSTRHAIQDDKSSCYRRLVGAFAITTAFYCLSKYVGIRVEVERVETEQKNDGKSGAAAEEEDDEDEDDEEDDAILFLPTGFSRPMQQTYYKGSDPEWQEFRKVVVDRPRVDKIRSAQFHELVEPTVADSLQMNYPLCCATWRIRILPGPSDWDLLTPKKARLG